MVRRLQNRELAKPPETHGVALAIDLFCIVIWKANRAKSKIAARLRERGHDSLEVACRALTSEIAKAEDNEARFMVLARDWRFRLPMASAVLTVLKSS